MRDFVWIPFCFCRIFECAFLKKCILGYSLGYMLGYGLGFFEAQKRGRNEGKKSAYFPKQADQRTHCFHNRKSSLFR